MSNIYVKAIQDVILQHYKPKDDAEIKQTSTINPLKNKYKRKKIASVEAHRTEILRNGQRLYVEKITNDLYKMHVKQFQEIGDIRVNYNNVEN